MGRNNVQNGSRIQSIESVNFFIEIHAQNLKFSPNLYCYFTSLVVVVSPLILSLTK